MSTARPAPADQTALTSLADRLRAGAKAYYDTDTPLMTDSEYDDGVEQLRIAVATDPALAPRFADLLESVAAGQSAGGDVTHSTLMGSMEKVVGIDSVAEFVADLGGDVVVEPKLDGLAVTAIYRDGSLALAATRGDGTRGEDVTENVRRLAVQGLPTTTSSALGAEVRGEVVVTDADFARAQELRTAEAKGKAFINSRSAAAGILRKGDPAYAGILTFAAYEVVPGTGSPTAGDHAERLRTVAAAGVTTVQSLVPTLPATPTSDVEDVLARVRHLGDHRADLGFPIDGAIVKAVDDTVRADRGHGSRAPRWAVAYKFEAETATTVVKAVTTAVGRTGRLAIRVEVEPVFVGGTTVTFATGHNVGWMLERDVRVGDTVTIKRAGDVIPYIVDVLLDARPAGSQAWEPPETDPAGNPWDTSTLLWRSTSPELSVLGRIVYAASRDCLDVEGMGTEVATALVDSGLVSDLADLVGLSVDQLTSLSLGGRALGAANGRKVHAELRRALDTPWNRVITALGIRATGRTMGRRLAAAFPTMARLRAATVEDLAAVQGIGPIKAELVHAGLRELEDAGVLDRLAAAGLNMGTEPDDGDVAALPLAGETVVVSGAVPGLTRGQVAEVIEAAGGKASSSVSSSTTVLVSEPSTSSKYTKATTLGIRIITPDELLTLLGE